MSTDPRIDAYIAKAAPFAQPILTHLRAVVHKALPGAVETIKWSMPHFMLDGKNIAGMSAFKAHCAFVIHGEGRQGHVEGDGMGHYGKIATMADVPPESELVAKLHEARERVAQAGTATPRARTRAPRVEIPTPDDFTAALALVPAAQATFDGFAPSHKRDYNEWITEAKTAPTRAKRIAQSVEWLAEGKRRNWKYENC